MNLAPAAPSGRWTSSAPCGPRSGPEHSLQKRRSRARSRRARFASCDTLPCFGPGPSWKALGRQSFQHRPFPPIPEKLLWHGASADHDPGEHDPPGAISPGRNAAGRQSTGCGGVWRSGWRPTPVGRGRHVEMAVRKARHRASTTAFIRAGRTRWRRFSGSLDPQRIGGGAHMRVSNVNDGESAARGSA